MFHVDRGLRFKRIPRLTFSLQPVTIPVTNPGGFLQHFAPRGSASLTRAHRGSSSYVSTSQQQLIDGLSVTTLKVKILVGSERQMVEPKDALRLAHRAISWRGSAKRIKWMRLEMERSYIWQPCYRTQKAAVYPPWPGSRALA